MRNTKTSNPFKIPSAIAKKYHFFKCPSQVIFASLSYISIIFPISSSHFLFCKISNFDERIFTFFRSISIKNSLEIFRISKICLREIAKITIIIEKSVKNQIKYQIFGTLIKIIKNVEMSIKICTKPNKIPSKIVELAFIPEFITLENLPTP